MFDHHITLSCFQHLHFIQKMLYFHRDCLYFEQNCEQKFQQGERSLRRKKSHQFCLVNLSIKKLLNIAIFENCIFKKKANEY